MLNICQQCKGVFVGPLAVVLISEKFQTRRYQLNCFNCGAKYRVIIEQIEDTILNSEDLDKIKNVPTK